MNYLPDSVLEDIENISFQIAKEVRSRFDLWKSGKVYIPRSALVAMAKRYQYLRDLDDMKQSQIYEFGRLFAWFALMYPPDGDLPSPADIAVDYSNLLFAGLPISTRP